MSFKEWDIIEWILNIWLVFMIGVLVIGIPLMIVYFFIGMPRNPCLENSESIESHKIKGVTWYKCCNEEWRIVNRDFNKTEECKLLRELPSYWEVWTR